MIRNAKKYSKPECTVIEIDGPFEPLLAGSVVEGICNENCGAWHLCRDREKMKGKTCYDKERMKYIL